MTAKDKAARRKLSLSEPAKELDRVSRACKVMGYIWERFSLEFRKRYVEAPHIDSLMAVDIFIVGTLKGAGNAERDRVPLAYGWARLYPTKIPATGVYPLNHDVLPTTESAGARIQMVLSDNRPKSNGIAERFHHTVLKEHLRVEG